MLTKLLRAEKAETAQPICWRRSAGPVAGIPGSASAPGASSQALVKTTGAEEQSGVLHARLLELENSLDGQIRAAREAGYREGEEAGRNQAAGRVQPVLEKLTRSIQDLADLKPKLRRDAEADLLKLALAIARKVLHRELSIDPDSIAGLISVSIEKIRAHEILRVRVHPQHQQIVRQILAKMSTATLAEIHPDPKLELGGVLVETSRGNFDASVDLQLKEIERGLTDRLANHR